MRESLRFSLVGQRIIYFHSRAVADGLQHLVAAGDDLVACVQAALDLDVSSAGEPGFHRVELGLLVLDHENALNIVVFLLARRRRRGGRGLLAFAGIFLRFLGACTRSISAITWFSCR